MNNEEKQEYRLNWATLKGDWPLWVLMLGLLLAGFLVYPYLPDQVPTHWNIYGEIDDYSSRAFGAFFPVAVTIGLYLLFLLLPLIDPKRKNYAHFARPYRFLRWGLVIFGIVLFAVTTLAALNYPVNVPMTVKGFVSILFILIGNYMGQFKHNYFVGIRTPWTLADERVWQRTHRLAAPLWVVGGLICLAMAPFNENWSAFIFFASIVAFSLIPVVYSYHLFRRLQEK